MKTKTERSVEEIAQRLMDNPQFQSSEPITVLSLLVSTLQAERQKRGEMAEEERLVSIELYQALKMMYTQYCPEPDTHQFMTTGENAEEKLDYYSYLNCDCEDVPEQQEENGHTRYCEALTQPNNPN